MYDPEYLTQNPNNYDLKGNWICAFPQQWFFHPQNLLLSKKICNSIKQHFPQGGKVGLNTEVIYFNYLSIYWLLNSENLLRGEKNEYHPITIFNSAGKYLNSDLVDANMLIFVSITQLQTSPLSARNSAQFLNYCGETLAQKDHAVIIKILALAQNYPFAGVVIFNQPMTSNQLHKAISSLSIESNTNDNTDISEIYGRKYTWEEMMQALSSWEKKRLDY